MSESILILSVLVDACRFRMQGLGLSRSDSARFDEMVTFT